MRLVIQRVKTAKVEVDNVVVGEIQRGLLVLLGVRDSDGQQELQKACNRVLTARCWPNEETGRAWEKNVVDIGGELLVVSQFTLYGSLKKTRPDFRIAMNPSQAEDLYSQFIATLAAGYAADKIKQGVFGAMMEVSLNNDGPVTFVYDVDGSAQ